MRFLTALLALLIYIFPLGLSNAEPKAPHSSASKNLYTIYTAWTQSPYHQMGQDIKIACPTLNIQVVPTSGSLENLAELIENPIIKSGHRFAFVLADSMGGFDKKATRIVFPLMTEDISIVVNKSSKIDRVKDMQGKRVAVGVSGSGVGYTAAAIKNQLGMSWTSLEQNPAESLLPLLTGEIDAAFVIGHPVKVFQELSPSMRDRIKIIPLADPELSKLYPTSKLESKTYPWQDEEILLRTTKLAFIAAADVTKEAENALISCLVQNQAELRKWGNSKWDRVNFSVKK